MPILTVSGDLSQVGFHEARILAEDMCHLDKQLKLAVVGLCENDWIVTLKDKKRTLGGKATEHGTGPFITHSALGYIGGLEDLCVWAEETYKWQDPRKDESKYHQIQSEFRSVSEETVAKLVTESENKFVFLDFFVGETKRLSSVVIELFVKKCPITCQNFLALCTGEKNISSSGTLLHYAHTYLHRIVKDGWIQAGDIVGKGKGTGGQSIWGKAFADESYEIKHDQPGIVGMANAGMPHTNGSQFYITLKEMPFFDNKTVAFGRVVMGFDSLQEINSQETVNERPIKSIIIGKCGIYNANAKKKLEEAAAAKAKMETLEAIQEKRPKNSKEATLLFLGVKGAGTTSVMNASASKLEDRPQTTNGFELNTFSKDGFNVRSQSVGGGEGLRGIWPSYFEEVHGVVFVVDSTNEAGLSTASEEFKKIAHHPKIAGKPVLLFANKQDVQGCMLESDIRAVFAKHVKKTTQPFRVMHCCAKVKATEVSTAEAAAVVESAPTEEKKDEANPKEYTYSLDDSISEGISWLLDEIKSQYSTLRARVDKDSDEKKRANKDKQASFLQAKVEEWEAVLAQKKAAEAEAIGSK